ncbi:MAG TPA: NAD(P)H-quinone oxidoreductase, partial [Limnochordia bacterium]|nr:NAD(P)H-quinone oxidoreductase [Limnochordia bacterium]
MQASVVDPPGGPEALVVREAPAPAPGPGEVLVRVTAAGINRADLMQRRGHYPPPQGASPLLGLEIAGVIETPAAGVTVWARGERVMALLPGGGYAELAAVPAGMLMRIPDGLSDAEAAGIPEAWLTAFLNLFWLGDLKAGETALIHAGGSGVGTAAIQLAKAAQARVFTTASAGKCERCRALGADLALDYAAGPFAEPVLAATGGRGADLILDFIGEPYVEQNLGAIAPDGRWIVLSTLGGRQAPLDLGRLMQKRVRLAGSTLRPLAPARKVALTQAFAQFALPRFASGTH